MRQTISVDSSAVIEAVTAEIYASYADLKSKLERDIDASTAMGKAELGSALSSYLSGIEAVVGKVVEDKVVAFLRSDAVADMIKSMVSVPAPVSRKPWWCPW